MGQRGLGDGGCGSRGRWGDQGGFQARLPGEMVVQGGRRRSWFCGRVNPASDTLLWAQVDAAPRVSQVLQKDGQAAGEDLQRLCAGCVGALEEGGEGRAETGGGRGREGPGPRGTLTGARCHLQGDGVRRGVQRR